MKTAATRFLLAALVCGVACERLPQDVPVVGVDPTSSPSSMESMTGAGEDELDVESAIEFDDQITVVSEIELAELLCDTLVDAEDAAALNFALLNGEAVVAARTSYTVTDGDAFTDGITRKVWTGTVINPAQAEDEAVPRTVSMAWGDVCDTETFLLKVTTQNVDGTVSVVKTIPCYGLTTHTCLLEVMYEFDEFGEAIPSDNDFTTFDGPFYFDYEEIPSTYASTTSEADASDRRLQIAADIVIDVMVLYSRASLTSLGRISSAQMDTTVIESLATTNVAFANSEVAVYFNPVHVGPLPYEQTSVDSIRSLTQVRSNNDVVNLRDSTGADLVQMIGYFDDGTCGRAYTFGNNEDLGFSTVKATCLDNLTPTHQYGHNFGCQVDRESTSVDTDYAHGLRYCDGEDPYRTIMSTSCGSPFVNYFSNPDVTFLNKPTGAATEDNARAIGDNMVAVSNFRNRGLSPSTPAPTTTAATTGSPFTAQSPSTAPPTTTLSSTYLELGCFGDDAGDRVLSGPFLRGNTTMTEDVCAAFCQGYRYFGTEFGEECFCGADSDDPTELGDAVCAFDCAGDSSQICGGRDAITVYEYETVIAPAEYVGCWNDNSNRRIMSLVVSDPSMTNSLCKQICASSDFFGTQFGVECWCGEESTDDYVVYGVSEDCTIPCGGDTDTICGGSFAMSVWECQ